MPGPAVAAAAPALSPMAAAGAAALGGIAEGVITSGFNIFGADQNRDFQRDMSNTAHQREVADLIKAGLNPVLSAKLGGASTPPGATATAGEFSPTAKALAALDARSRIAVNQAQIQDLHSAAALKNAQRDQIEYTREDNLKLVRAQVENTLASANLSKDTREKLASEVRRLDAEIEGIQLRNAHSAYGLDQAKRESELFRGRFGRAAIMRKHLGMAGTALGYGTEFQKWTDEKPLMDRAKEYLGEKFDKLLRKHGVVK